MKLWTPQQTWNTSMPRNQKRQGDPKFHPPVSIYDPNTKKLLGTVSHPNKKVDPNRTMGAARSLENVRNLTKQDAATPKQNRWLTNNQTQAGLKNKPWAHSPVQVAGKADLAAAMGFHPTNAKDPRIAEFDAFVKSIRPPSHPDVKNVDWPGGKPPQWLVDGFNNRQFAKQPATPPWQQHIPGTGGIKPTREAVAAWEQQHGPGSAWGSNTQTPVATSPATPAQPTVAPTTNSFPQTRPDYERGRRRIKGLKSLQTL